MNWRERILNARRNRTFSEVDRQLARQPTECAIGEVRELYGLEEQLLISRSGITYENPWIESYGM
jgi:hypothetical protein